MALPCSTRFNETNNNNNNNNNNNIYRIIHLHSNKLHELCCAVVSYVFFGALAELRRAIISIKVCKNKN